MIKLTDTQYQELQQFLGCDPNVYGEWSRIPTEYSYVHVINSRGNMLIRLTCTGKDGRILGPLQLKFTEDDGHYLMCSIGNQIYKLHRLMAQIWLDDYSESLTVNHRDGNKHNNDYHNLEMLTVHDNCTYYHTSAQIAEQRAKDYAHHGDTIRGRIHITNGTDARMIYESDGIPEGWWRGRPQSMKDAISDAIKGHPSHNRGKIPITDGTTNRWIHPIDVIPEGWKRGYTMYLSTEQRERRGEYMRGRIYINKNEVNKRIHQDELESYLQSGWKIGVYRKKNIPK